MVRPTFAHPSHSRPAAMWLFSRRCAQTDSFVGLHSPGVDRAQKCRLLIKFSDICVALLLAHPTAPGVRCNGVYTARQWTFFTPIF